MKTVWKPLCGLVLAASLLSPLAGCGNTLRVITLDKRNGEALEKIEAPHIGARTYKSGAKLFPNPTRKDWFFDGWYLDEACTQTAYDVPVEKDVTFYAGWTDSITVPQTTPAWLIVDYTELFTITATAAPYGSDGEVKLTVTVTPTGDFTGEKSADEIEMQISYDWLSDEQFMGEYVSDEVVSYACTRLTLKKENGFAVQNEVFIVDKYNCNNVHSYTFNNPRTRIKIHYIFYEPTLQYNHSAE